MAYTKLFSSIVTSSLWSEDSDTCKLWVTMMALADKNGEVQGTVPGLARVASLSIPAVEEGINKFSSPDKYSRTPDDDGRRIEGIDGGWILLNHGKYRDMASREESKRSNAIRQQRFRDKKARNAVGHEREKCVYCGKKAAGVDHIIPRSKGGSDEPGNLVRSCKRCNGHKASRELVDFLNDFTLPYKLDEDSILSDSNLSRIVTLRNGSFEKVTHTLHIAEADADTDAEADTDCKSQAKEKNGYSSSDVQPTKSRSESESTQSEGEEAPRYSLENFRKMARGSKVDEDFAESVWTEWEANGWKDEQGKPVKSPAVLLSARWRAFNAKGVSGQPKDTKAAQKPAESQAWKIEKDIARIKKEIQEVESNRSNRNYSDGHVLNREDYRRKLEPEWHAYLRKARDEFRDNPKCLDDWKAFRAEFDEKIAKSPIKLKAEDWEAAEMEELSEKFPEDVATFDRWSEAKGKVWIDPDGLKPEARVTVKILKGRIEAMESERRAGMISLPNDPVQRSTDPTKQC